MIDWFDVAPAVLFAVVAGLAARFIVGGGVLSVLLGVAYILLAGFVAAAAVAYVGLDEGAGFLASLLLSAILIRPLWLYAQAADLTQVSEAEMDGALSDAEEAIKALAAGPGDHEPFDDAAMYISHFDHILRRLADDAPRRQEMVDARERLDRAYLDASSS